MTLRKWILALALVGLLTAAGCAGAAVAAPNDQEDSNGDAADEGPQANQGIDVDVDVEIVDVGERPFSVSRSRRWASGPGSGWRSPRGRARAGGCGAAQGPGQGGRR